MLASFLACSVLLSSFLRTSTVSSRSLCSRSLAFTFSSSARSPLRRPDGENRSSFDEERTHALFTFYFQQEKPPDFFLLWLKPPDSTSGSSFSFLIQVLAAFLQVPLGDLRLYRLRCGSPGDRLSDETMFDSDATPTCDVAALLLKI